MFGKRPTKKDLTTRLDWVFENFFTDDLSEDEINGPTNGDKTWGSWNGKSWNELFKKYYENYSEVKRCGLRCLTLQSTVHVSRNMTYKLISKDENNEEVEIKLNPEAMKNTVYNTRFYTNDYEYKWDIERNSLQRLDRMANIRVVNADCVEASFILKEQVNGEKVALLNMANAYSPSAGWPMKYGTQEEQLFRRSNLYQCLDNEVDGIEKERKWKYPIDEFGQIFSPEVMFFRSGENDGYNFIKPRILGVLTAAALASPATEFDNEKKVYRLKKDAETKMRKKIGLLFKVCLEHGFKNVVLSAWGSGAFRTPPKHIAELFQSEILKYGFYFENIWFSILDDGFSFRQWNKKGNLLPYAEVFNEEGEKLEYKYSEF